MENKNWALPASIIVAGLIIAGTVYYTNTNTKKPSDNLAATGDVTSGQKLDGPKEVTSSDHILGNPNADLTFILFTDLECPFCKTFNATANQMMDEYGKAGKMRFVLRHFPLDSLHQKSRKEAEATECAADLGGNDKFWTYVNRLFEVTTSNDTLDPTQLPKIAEYVGLDVNKFNDCLSSGKFAAKVQTDYEDAVASGARGTPYSVILTKNGDKYPVSGALPYAQLKVIIDQILNGTYTTGK
ncbi:MAG: hypothetical protein Athens071426_573 [Parcubacteria group bacterium Athens0714_26]|nr:MAG: hypothetical protein Athens071426_573 [Parcubacteria group bacterium Athens0714_26]